MENKNIDNQTPNNSENISEENKTKTSDSGLNKNAKIALIVVGVLVLLGIIWRVQAYMTYRSYKKQADTLQEAAEDYQKTYLKQMNDMSKQVMDQQKKAMEEMNEQMESME